MNHYLACKMCKNGNEMCVVSVWHFKNIGESLQCYLAKKAQPFGKILREKRQEISFKKKKKQICVFRLYGREKKKIEYV